MFPIISITIFCTCRTCGKEDEVVFDPNVPLDECDTEKLSLEALEDADWIDSQCPECYQKLIEE